MRWETQKPEEVPPLGIRHSSSLSWRSHLGVSDLKFRCPNAKIAKGKQDQKKQNQSCNILLPWYSCKIIVANIKSHWLLNSLLQHRSHSRSPEGGHQEQDPSNRQNGQSVLSSQVGSAFLPFCLEFHCVSHSSYLNTLLWWLKCFDGKGLCSLNCFSLFKWKLWIHLYLTSIAIP